MIREVESLHHTLAHLFCVRHGYVACLCELEPLLSLDLKLNYLSAKFMVLKKSKTV